MMKRNLLNYKLFKIILLLIIILLFFGISLAKAQEEEEKSEPQSVLQLSGIKESRCLEEGICQFNDFLKIGVYITRAIVGIAGVWVLIMFVFGGLVWITSSGNPERVKQGKNVFVGSLIGLLVIFFGWTVVNLTICGLQGETPDKTCKIFGQEWNVFPQSTDTTTSNKGELINEDCKKIISCTELDTLLCNNHNNSESECKAVTVPKCQWISYSYTLCTINCSVYSQSDCPTGSGCVVSDKNNCINRYWYYDSSTETCCQDRGAIFKVEDIINDLNTRWNKQNLGAKNIFTPKAADAVKDICQQTDAKCGDAGSIGGVDAQTYYYIRYGDIP